MGTQTGFVSLNTAAAASAALSYQSVGHIAIHNELRLPLSDNVFLDEAAFNMMLSWLDPDIELAGQKYETIRRKLITIFRFRGCEFPEDLSDITFNRVAGRLPQIIGCYIGDPERFFYGVANKIYLEYLRRLTTSHKMMPVYENSFAEDDLNRLDRCLEKLSEADRNLILGYYNYEGRPKIEHRRKLAEELGIPLNALRIRACRIRARLQKSLLA